ncbi:MAG TPA: extracellular solute-binding protein, partial [Ktedonobacteraceae bacterium]|nr:extracellular solute-binding protein [Ktedonobacteraceae bacterium]
MKRIATTLTPVFIILMLVLAACGGDNGSSSSNGNNGVNQQGIASGNSYISCPGSTNTTAAAPESGSVTLTVSGFSSSPAEDALVQANLKNFETAHPNIKLNWSPISGDYPTKMRANIAGNTVPDVFYLQPTMSNEYISSGKLLNLSPYMTKDNVNASDYYSALTNPFVCTKGDVYGLPKDWNSLGVFYNKQMFKDAGLAEPTANWTWSDMQTDAQKLTKNAGKS